MGIAALPAKNSTDWFQWASDIDGGVRAQINQSVDLRFRGMPRLMSNPPTVTVTNDKQGTTTLASTGPSLPGVSYTNTAPLDTTKWRALGVGAATPTAGSSGLQAYSAGWSSGPTNGQTVTIEFLFDGLACELMLRQFGGSQYRVIVDGEYVTRYPQTFGGTAGSFGNLKIAFASAGLRRIGVEFNASGGAFFGGIWKGPLETVRAADMPARRLCILGDSYTGGAFSSQIGSWGIYAARAMGFRDYLNAGLGGSGFIAATTVNGTAYNAANRLAGDVVANVPTDLVIALGHNDTSSSNTDIATALTNLLTSVRSGLPKLRSLVVVGPLWQSDNTNTYGAMNTAMKNASGLADAYVDTVASPIFTGTGRVGATTGSGNADTYIGTDGVHPTDAGSEWLGYALAYAITDALA